jgi:hypothetical protein
MGAFQSLFASLLDVVVLIDLTETGLVGRPEAATRHMKKASHQRREAWTCSAAYGVA